MKKIIDFTTIAILVAAAAGIVFSFDVGNELTGLVKNVVHKIVPWVNIGVYT